MDLHISVSAKWYPEKKTKYETLRSGWICKSNNPEIETERFETYQEAFESFIQLLKDNWSSTWENYPHIEVGDPVARGKADRFSVDDTGEFTLSLYEDEVSVSWLIALTKPVNRTLSDFEITTAYPDGENA